ncbi:transketolase, partial [bacterium]|nr:transketolase [bacterium]
MPKSTTETPDILDLRAIATLKGLVIDGVHKAKSGHPGGAMSSMDFAYLLFTEHLNFDPDDPAWIGRDRFILSAGHESMLIYSLLHLTGWLSVDDLKKFRQLHSRTPGHPENVMTPGVECTTGPLGQGAAMSVGFAIAARHLAATMDERLFGHRTWVLLGDGCMQEDVTLGAASLAGHLGLSNLTWFYDRNRQQISGAIDRATSDDEVKIFEGFGWEVIRVDGHDHDALRAVMGSVSAQTKPRLIIGDTVMAKGAATMEGDHETHGSPLPAEERAKTKQLLGLDPAAEFEVDPATRDHFQRRFATLRAQAKSWKSAIARRVETDAAFKTMWDTCFGKEDFSRLKKTSWPKDKPVATRNAFGDVLRDWATQIPNLVGGSADLEPSNMTGAFAKITGDFQKATPKGRNLAFGVREFPMSAIANGIALHGGLIPFDATFLTFSDYSRPALRLGAIQQCRVIHEFTHDSFHLGEDGPTHQPVEHVMTLRAIPDFYVMRPADAFETQIMMEEALKLRAPSAICLTRQKLPVLPVTEAKLEEARKGAWVVREVAGFNLLILATGSEVSLALDAAAILEKDNPALKIRVVSMPCWEIFEKQTVAWRESVIPSSCRKRVSIEAGVTLGWQKYTGNAVDGLCIGLDHFGASAPAEHLAEEYGFTPAKVAARVRQWL